MLLLLRTGETIKAKMGHNIFFGPEKCSVITEDNKVLFLEYTDIFSIREA